MLSIGDLARHTGVSVRMLRHYDELGLVRPVRVDDGTGYRWYSASQVGRVDALLALKELGFSLAECREILDEQVSAEGLRDLLRHRAAELAERIEDDTARLAEVGRRLRSIDRGLTMTNRTLEIRPLPALRLAQVSGHANDTSEIPTVVSDLVDELSTLLGETASDDRGSDARDRDDQDRDDQDRDDPSSGVRGSGSQRIDVRKYGVRTYYGHPDGTRIDVAVGLPLTGSDVRVVDGVEVVELPAVDTAAVVVYRGPASEIAEAWRTFDVATDQHGLTPYGVHRQVLLEITDDDEVVVELQCPVRTDPACC